MFTDPVSVHQLRRADLIEAAQYRRQHPVDARSRRRFPLGRVAAPPNPLDRSLELFVGLDRRTLRRLARRFDVRDLDAGEVLARQGVTESRFVVVLDGRIGVSLDGMPITVFDRGSYFGALPLIDGSPDRFALASYDALEATRIAVADRSQFADILARFPAVAARVLRTADIRRAYLAGHADATALYVDREVHPFPVHVPATV